MPLEQLKRMKVYGETAIPAGIYAVRWSLSPKFGKYMPELDNVPAFLGIRMHSGVTAKDSLGCILLGENKVVGQLINSRKTCNRVYRLILAAIDRGELVTIEIS